MWCACKSSTGEKKKTDLYGSLARQPILICELQAYDMPCLKQNLGGILGMIFEGVLWPPNTCIHMFACTYTQTLVCTYTAHTQRMLT